MLATPDAVFEDARNCAAFEMPELVLSHVPADEPGIADHLLIVQMGIRCKIGLNLEKLLEVFIQVIEDTKQCRCANEQYLDIKGNRLWPVVAAGTAT